MHVVSCRRGGGTLARGGGVGGAVVGGVSMTVTAVATADVGGLFETGFGLSAAGCYVGGVVDVDVVCGGGVVGWGDTTAGATGATRVDGGGRDDVVFTVGRRRGGAVGCPGVDAVDVIIVVARGVCGKGDLGNRWGR